MHRLIKKPRSPGQTTSAPVHNYSNGSSAFYRPNLKEPSTNFADRCLRPSQT